MIRHAGLISAGMLASPGVRFGAVATRMVPGFRGWAQDKPRAQPAAQPAQRQKDRKKLACHNQNGITISATCWT
jgi:hypothetical protein